MAVPTPGFNRKALDECSREPIHIPGAIQPHGALIVLEQGTFRVLQVSANVQNLCGWTSNQLLEQCFLDQISEKVEWVRAAFEHEDPLIVSPITVHAPRGAFDCLIHKHDGLLILELEPVQDGPPARSHRRLQKVFAEMRQALEPAELYQIMARFIAQLTGYERVMVYRFDEDWHGEVVGECLLAEVDSYFGHHFPASDIPEQARALYTRSWLRIIPDAHYAAVPLQPLLNPLTERPTDLSFSVLRSVSPVHLEYLKNMDVGASMSISLIIEGKLWGLIACHHREPRPLAQPLRAACEVFGQVASLEIAAKAEKALLSEYMDASRIQTRFFDIISSEQNVLEALVHYGPELIRFMNAGGAAIYLNEQFTLLGDTPPESVLNLLVGWLNHQELAPTFVTDSLSTVYPQAVAMTSIASGMLALKLSHALPNYIIWFRPEVITTVTWAGNPDKAVEPGQILHPRKSFAAWKQTVTGRSLPWKETEKQGAIELRSAINALVLRRNQQLIRENVDLEKKNTDLNSFAYIASHDLREPLRGISHYSTFILEDHEAVLPYDAVTKLKKISGLAVDSERLLDALSHYSRIGRMEINRRETELDEVLDKVLRSLDVTIEENSVTIRQPESLPVLACDAVLVKEVLLNLISNAIRYNLSKEKWVEIGSLPVNESRKTPVIYVKDNGIGIRKKHFDAVFTIFRRLNVQGSFGDGSGAGLAIARSIVERHGGQIWVESEPNIGTTFFFTLS